MNFGIWSYFISIFIFGGIVILLESILFKKYIKGSGSVFLRVIFCMIVFGVLGEWVAFKFDIWGYYEGKILGIFVGSTIESILFVIAITFCISIPVLYFVKKSDSKHRRPLVGT